MGSGQVELKHKVTGNMCPVSPNIPTRMTREGFVRACKGIRHGGKFKLESDCWLCPDCLIKELIDEGKKFSPPSGNIKFVDLGVFKDELDGIEDMRALISSRKAARDYPLLTRAIATFIREWHKKVPEYSISAKARKLGLSRKQVSRVINGDTWK